MRISDWSSDVCSSDLLAVLTLPEVGIHSFEGLKTAVDPDRITVVNFDAEKIGFTFFYILLGHLVLGLWYWCIDQSIVQCVLGARSEMQARLGAIFSGFLTFLPVKRKGVG